MQTWYECKVKYLKIDQGGYERKVNDNYLLDAVSYTDAEARIFQKMREITSSDFQVMNIKRSNIAEVIPSETGEWWYKAKISLVTIDEEAGKEKKFTQYILIMADDIGHALKRLEEGLSYMLVPYVTTALQLSTIVEVYPYDDMEQDVRVVKRESPTQTEAYKEEPPIADLTSDTDIDDSDESAYEFIDDNDDNNEEESED